MLRARLLTALLPVLVLAADPRLPAGFDEPRRAGLIVRPHDEPSLRVLCWNIERGERFEGVAAALASLPSGLILLQEVDRHARRSGNRDIAAELAGRLGMESVFGAEFAELSQGAGGQEALHGQAALFSLPAATARILRFRTQDASWRPKSYLPNWAIFQPRLGGRMALVTEHATAQGLLVAYNVHLESRGPESLRAAQIQEVLEDARRYPPEATILIAGDLNTKRATSPVTDAIRAAGFTLALGGEVTSKRGQPLDWIFLRGPWRAEQGRVHTSIRAADHFPLTVTLYPAGAAR